MEFNYGFKYLPESQDIFILKDISIYTKGWAPRGSRGWHNRNIALWNKCIYYFNKKLSLADLKQYF